MRIFSRTAPQRFTRIRPIFILKNGTAAGSARFSFLKWHSRRICEIFTF